MVSLCFTEYNAMIKWVELVAKPQHYLVYLIDNNQVLFCPPSGSLPPLTYAYFIPETKNTPEELTKSIYPREYPTDCEKLCAYIYEEFGIVSFKIKDIKRNIFE